MIYSLLSVAFNDATVAFFNKNCQNSSRATKHKLTVCCPPATRASFFFFFSFNTMRHLADIFFVVGDADDSKTCMCVMFWRTGAFTLQLDTGHYE